MDPKGLLLNEDTRRRDPRVKVLGRALQLNGDFVADSTRKIGQSKDFAKQHVPILLTAALLAARAVERPVFDKLLRRLFLWIDGHWQYYIKSPVRRPKTNCTEMWRWRDGKLPRTWILTN